MKDIYRIIWQAIGGRRWTYIWRDVYEEAEWLIHMMWFFTGLGIYHFFGWFGVILFCLAYSYGYLDGHFHWGTKKIRGQKEELK